MPEPQSVLGMKSLHAIGTGPIENARPEGVEWIVAQPSFERLLNRYDCTLIDTPPLSASNDALLFGHRADGCLMVISRKTYQDRAEAKFADQLLKEGIPIVGMIITRYRALEARKHTVLGNLGTWLGLRA